jgi:O-antigen ligase
MSTRRIDQVAYCLILAFPVSIISVKILGPLIYVLLALIGIYYAVRKKASPFTVKELKLFSWLTFGYFMVMALSVALSSEPTNDWVHLSRKVQFLIAPFVGLVFYCIKVPIETILKSLKIGVILAGIIVLVQYGIGGYGSRLSGMFNPNTFGDIVAVMILLSIANAINEKQLDYILSLFSVSFGAMAVVLSASRASIIVLFALLLVYGVVMCLKTSKKYVKSWTIALLGIVILSVGSLTTGVVGKRMNLIQSEIHQWERGENRTSSVAARLEMYRAGIKAFLDAPVIGYGYRNANEVASRYLTGEASRDIRYYSHLHNEYLTNAVNAGIVGLVMLLVLFCLPLKKFLHKLRFERNSTAIAGVFLVLGFMLNGILHASLQWEYQNSFFVFFLGVFLLQIQENKQELDDE